MIQFQNVSKEYLPGEPVVSDMTLDIKDGEFFVIIGPSGSGKTTALKMINRLIPLTTGWIKMDGQPISEFPLHELRWNIGYVLQQIALFPHMSVEENILVVPEMKQWENERMRDRVTELLERVGLDPETYRNRRVSELSGGEQQRIGVARALAADPDVILMDEPFSALDPISRNQLQEDVLRLQKDLKKTVVFVTHDMQEALRLGDRICLMNHGKIEQIGTPEEILEQPKNDFVRDFLRTGLPDYREKVLIKELVSEGFLQPAAGQADASPLLSVEESIDSLVVALSSHPSVSIQETDGSVLGTVTQASLLGFLARDLKEHEEVPGT